MNESRLQAALLLAAPGFLPDLRLFRRNVMVARVEGRSVRTCIKGQCDLYGYIRGGKTIEVELKSAKGRMRPEQRAWAAWCVGWGIPHLVLKAQAEETVEQTVERWCDEIGLAVGLRCVRG